MLNKAFDLVKIMKEREIQPNLIYFTNLVHISFFMKNPQSVEKAYQMCLDYGLKIDSIFYSKIIDGMLYMKKKNRIAFFM